MNSPGGEQSRTICRSERNGEMNAVSTISPASSHEPRDLSHAADVLDAVRVGEAEVLVQPVADVVAVEQEGVLAQRVAASSRPGWRWWTCRRRTGP